MIGGRGAIIFGALLLAALSVNLVLVRSDAARLDLLETVEQPSAVGDTRYFAPPEELEEGQVVTMQQGRRLLALQHKPAGHDDGMMVRAGSDDRGFVLYRSIREKDGQLRYPGQLFLKTSDNKYLPLKPAP